MNISDIVDNFLLEPKEKLDNYRRIFDMCAENSDYFDDKDIEIGMIGEIENKISQIISYPLTISDIDLSILKKLLLLQSGYYDLSKNVNSEKQLMYDRSLRISPTCFVK